MDMCMDARWCISQLLHSLLSFFLCISLYRYCCFLLCVVNNNSNKQQTTTWIDNTKGDASCKVCVVFSCVFWCLWTPNFSHVTAVFFWGKGVVRGRERHVQGGLYLIVCYLMVKCFYSTRESEKERGEKRGARKEREEKERDRGKEERDVWKKEREIAWRGIEPLRFPWCD